MSNNLKNTVRRNFQKRDEKYKSMDLRPPQKLKQEKKENNRQLVK